MSRDLSLSSYPYVKVHPAGYDYARDYLESISEESCSSLEESEFSEDIQRILEVDGITVESDTSVNSYQIEDHEYRFEPRQLAFVPEQEIYNEVVLVDNGSRIAVAGHSEVIGDPVEILRAASPAKTAQKLERQNSLDRKRRKLSSLF